MAAVTIPKWFDWNAYLNNKLVEVGSGTMDSLVSAMNNAGYKGPEGYYMHFLQWGHKEDVSPSAGFDANQYYAFKAAEAYKKDISQVNSADISTIKQAIHDAGMDAWTHYQKFGTSEGINASNSFDTNAYLQAKSVAMGGSMTAAQVADAIQAAGMNAYEHYMQYKGGSGEVAADATFVVPANSQVDTPGLAFTLTTGTDIATSNLFDAPIEVASQTGNPVQTLQSVDNLTGTGTNPTLNATVNSAILAAPTLSGIEILNLQPIILASNLSFAKTTGLKTVNVDSSGTDFTGRHIGSNVAVGVSNGVTGNHVLMKFNDSVVAGANTGTVNLTNNGAATVTSTQVVNLAGEKAGGFETLAITAEGVNRIGNIGSDATSVAGAMTNANNVARTITVGGTGSLRVENALTTITTFDASANTGGVRVTLDNVSVVTATGGSGNDWFNLANTLTNGDKINGGDGRDTLQTSNVLGAGNQVTNVEILQNDGAATFDNDDATSIDAIVHNMAGVATYSDMVGSNAADPAKGLTLLGTGAATYTIKGSDTLGATSDSLYVTMGSATGTTGVNIVNGAAGAVTTTGTEKLTINVIANDVAANTASGITSTVDASAQSIILKGGAVGQAFVHTLAGTSGAALTLIDASEFVGGLTVTGNANAQVIRGGSGNDVIGTGGRGIATTNGDVLTGNAGNDTFTFAASDSTAALPNAAVTGAFTAAQVANFTQVTDLNLGGSTAATAVDLLDLRAVDAAFTGATTAVMNAGAATALTGANFGAAVDAAIVAMGAPVGPATAVAGLYTWSGLTFLIATNDGDAYDIGDDIVIDVTGVTGTLNNADFA